MRMRSWPLLFLFLTSCGGIRTGYFNMPYIDDEEPTLISASSFERDFKFNRVVLPGIQLKFSPVNQTETSDFILLGVIPAPQNKRTTVSHNDAAHCIRILYRPFIEHIHLDPYLINLSVNGKTQTVTTVVETKYYRDETNSVQSAIIYIPNSTASMELTTSTWITTCFANKKPAEDDVIKLDLNEAITHPDGTEMPIINFKKIRYIESYS